MTPSSTNKIIEIIGPPGVGKSTLYNMLCKTWDSDLNWIYQDALLAPAKPNMMNFTKWIEYKYRIILGKKRAKSIPVDYGLRFIKNNEEFANLCWNYLTNSNHSINRDIDKRFRSAYFLFADYCRYQAIKEKASVRKCIIEEGFLQKSFLVQKNDSAFSLFLEDYISLLPLPYAVIYIDVLDRSLITERIWNRSKTIASHIGKDNSALLQDIKNWQDTLNCIVTKLEQQNVIIFRIDGAKALNDNLLLIKEILNKI